MDYCIARSLERSSITSEKEMEKFILKTDRFRGDYYHYYTGRTWNDARNYDLCLDSAAIGLDNCVEVIKRVIELKFGVKCPR